MTTYQRREYTIQRLSGVVTSVSDGDTVKIEVGYGWLGLRKETLHIRFAGMDTPETTENQPFAEEAKQYVITKILNRRVTLEVAKLKGSGQYIMGVHGRVVGVIYPSLLGLSLNVELVKKGLAKVYPKDRCSWMTGGLWRELLAAEKRARRKQLGVWSTVHPEASQVWSVVVGIGLGMVLCVIILLSL